MAFNYDKLKVRNSVQICRSYGMVRKNALLEIK